MKLNNKYYILRHGEALSNLKNIVSSWPEKFRNPITVKGVQQIKKSLNKLRNKHIDLIFTSDLLRTKQTAVIAGKLLKIKPMFDKRLREVGFGDLNGQPAEELLFLSFEKRRIDQSIKKGETYQSVLKRVTHFLKDIDKKYKNKNILLVSHQCPLWILENKVNGLTLDQGLKKIHKEKRIKRGELRELN